MSETNHFHDMIDIDGELIFKDVAFELALATGSHELLNHFWDHYTGPVRRKGRILFVTRARPGERLRITCDALDTSDPEPLLTCFDPTFRYRWVPVMHSKPVYYRFHGRHPYVDPQNRFLSFTGAPGTSVVYGEGRGRLLKLLVPPGKLGAGLRPLFVYLPAVCFDQGVKVPAIYMQDGDNLFRGSPRAPFGTWNIAEQLDVAIARGVVAPVAVVGITTENRADEYLHADDLWGENQVGRLTEYTEFVTGTLIPAAEEALPLLSGSEHRAISGSSFGGTSSFLMAWRNPHVFSKVASFSHSTGTGLPAPGGVDRSLLATIRETTPLPDLKIYVDSGDSEHDGSRTYTSDSRAHTDHLRNWLISKGWAGRKEYCAPGETAPRDYPVTSDFQSVPTLYHSPETPQGYRDYRDYLKPEQNLLHLLGVHHKHNEEAWEARVMAAFQYLFPSA